MTSTRSRIGLTACFALAVVYAWLAARSFQAARLASSLDVASLQRAIALEPRNAAYQDLLCRFRLFDQQAAGEALPRCQRATELNPYSSTYWLDLALAYYNVGAEQEQRQAIARALSVDPKTPDVAWNVANLLLAQGKVAAAMQHFSTAMRGNPYIVQPTLELTWRTLHDANTIQASLPPRPDAYLKFIRLLVANQQWDAAQRAWSAMLLIPADGDIDYRQALFYIDALLQKREPALASATWQQLASRSAALKQYSGDHNLVVNGGFEQPMLNAGFGWRYWPQSGSAVAADPREFNSGSQSLRISYNGVSGDAGVLQYVAVKPDTQYTISAGAKSQQLDAANGPTVSVSDAYDSKPLASTQETLGTTPWHRLETSFQTGPQTQLLAIRITRDPADTHVRGKFWLDDVAVRGDVGEELSPQRHGAHGEKIRREIK